MALQVGLDAVLKLLDWSWSLLNIGLRSSPPMPHTDAQHLSFVARSSLILLQTYIQEAYPRKQKMQGKFKQNLDGPEVAEMVYRAQVLLRQILSAKAYPAQGKEGSNDPYQVVVEACCTAFRACFHAFYPTTSLKWLCLCQHIQMLDPVSSDTSV